MNHISYEGIGRVVVTAELGAGAELGGPVQFTGNGVVSAAAEGKKVDGVVVSAREGFGGIAVAGFVRLPCDSGVTVGTCKVVANGSGGVKVGSAGCEVLVAAVENGVATILL